MNSTQFVLVIIFGLPIILLIAVAGGVVLGVISSIVHAVRGTAAPPPRPTHRQIRLAQQRKAAEKIANR